MWVGPDRLAEALSEVEGEVEWGPRPPTPKRPPVDGPRSPMRTNATLIPSAEVPLITPATIIHSLRRQLQTRASASESARSTPRAGATGARSLLASREESAASTAQ